MGKTNLTGFVNVNIKLNLNDSDEYISNIAKLIKEGDYVDDKKIIKLKGKELVMYLLAARLKEKKETNVITENKTENTIVNNAIIDKDKFSKFGIKSPSP